MEKNSNKKRRRRRLSWREWLILAIPTVSAVIAVSVAMVVTDQETTYHLPDSGRQYYGGVSAPVAEGEGLKLAEDGSVEFESNQNVSTLPIYLDNSRTLVLTSDMLYYMPRSDSYGRAVSISEISCDEHGMIKVNWNNNTIKPEPGFLYDGADFYLFLEPVTIAYMGYTVELPALSYAEVINGGNIMLFNYETKEFTIEMLEGAAVAQTPHGDYTISLLGDSMTNIDGELTLLMTKVKEADPMIQ